MLFCLYVSVLVWISFLPRCAGKKEGEKERRNLGKAKLCRFPLILSETGTRTQTLHFLCLVPSGATRLCSTELCSVFNGRYILSVVLGHGSPCCEL
ncbi:uncharacterized protein CYBJADRAFT_99518 [Cyberlindnera jadinii NRRL Y-1542]|uniref:Secreted protein n=1 Tax=Cyberlindnera jadinii (strain ATCC 18201 / CBS 1600 / BCRC 20928 / JCM 3617 / NBRC 0987 / NRRL Y-1542) TaxID=983966 RepID=A0A1E4RZN4_CYBJN|nr:hypothetical protein CYBJADRAFT_99518 [Cyberlindnera jadinii NRRL Y-1542]ODV72708.1 hypothetical protein CYBJADRAFT_99518 [Cyberlindnera jadinii NRRL Y-1542]